MRKARPPKARSRKIPGVMNSTEQAYFDNVLLPRLQAGEYTKVIYEGITFKLAPKTTYTPDFFVVKSDREIELHECKGGYTRDDARVKWKVAADMYPFFTWRMIHMKGLTTIKKEEVR